MKNGTWNVPENLKFHLFDYVCVIGGNSIRSGFGKFCVNLLKKNLARKTHSKKQLAESHFFAPSFVFSHVFILIDVFTFFWWIFLIDVYIYTQFTHSHTTDDSKWIIHPFWSHPFELFASQSAIYVKERLLLIHFRPLLCYLT